MNRFRFKSGVITERTAMALNDIAAWIEREERTRKGDSEFPTVERLRVKLTAHNGGTPPIYTGVEQSFTIAGVEEDKPNGKSFSPTNQPIYERNGQTVSAAALTAGYHCWVDRRTLVDGTPTYEFDIGNPSTSGSFTLAGRTGTQTIASGDTLTLNNGVVSATDTWTPDVASASLAGIVNTSAQTLGDGIKTLRNGPILNSTKSDSLTTAYGSVISVDDGTVYSDGSPGLYSANSTTTIGATKWIGVRVDTPSGGVAVDFPNIEAYVPSGDLLGLAFDADQVVGSGLGRLILFGGSASGFTSAYSVLDGDTTTIYDGATGTSGGGDTVKGGIVTALGSALTGFTDELAQDAVGTILVDSSTIDLTYNDGTPSITAAAIYQMSITADASGLKLSGDSASPGNDYFYGTDAGGTKGWYAVPVASVTDTATVDLTLTGSALSADVIKQMSITSDASGLMLDGDAASPGNSYYYGTDSGGTKGFYTLPQAADVGALTDSTGGTANTTLVAIAGTGDDTNLNDNFADLVAQINALRTALRNAGLMA